MRSFTFCSTCVTLRGEQRRRLTALVGDLSLMGPLLSVRRAAVPRRGRRGPPAAGTARREAGGSSHPRRKPVSRSAIRPGAAIPMLGGPARTSPAVAACTRTSGAEDHLTRSGRRHVVANGVHRRRALAQPDCWEQEARTREQPPPVRQALGRAWPSPAQAEDGIVGPSGADGLIVHPVSGT